MPQKQFSDQNSSPVSSHACAKAGYTDDLVPAIVGEVPYAKIFEELPRALVKLARQL